MDNDCSLQPCTIKATSPFSIAGKGIANGHQLDFHCAQWLRHNYTDDNFTGWLLQCVTPHRNELRFWNLVTSQLKNICFPFRAGCNSSTLTSQIMRSCKSCSGKRELILADSVQKPQFRRLPGKCSYCSYCSMVCDEVSYTFPVCSLEKKLANFRNNPSLFIVLYRAYVSVLPESRHTRRRVIKYQHSNFMLHECLISA